MSNFSTISEKLDTCLQRDVEIVLENKTIRKGTFILYTIKDYYLSIILKTPHTNKSYDILYPFDVEIDQNRISFSYDTAALIANQYTHISDNIKEIAAETSNKFINKTLHINLT